MGTKLTIYDPNDLSTYQEFGGITKAPDVVSKLVYTGRGPIYLERRGGGHLVIGEEVKAGLIFDAAEE